MGYSFPWLLKPEIPSNAEFPVTRVSWKDANNFCKCLSWIDRRKYRLPAKVEWEFACRAGTTTRFYCGDSERELGRFEWHIGNMKDLNRPNPVGTKQANPFGLFDMHGNVSEWCRDLSAVKFELGNEPAEVQFVYRGGSWNCSPDAMRSAFEAESIADFSSLDLGLRIAVDVEFFKPAFKLDAQTEQAILPIAGVKGVKQYQRAWGDRLHAEVQTVNSLGMKLMLIPPGEFQMGAPETDEDAGRYVRIDEWPQHRVRITRGFYLGKYEVT